MIEIFIFFYYNVYRVESTQQFLFLEVKNYIT